MNSQQVFRLFASCVPVKGYLRSTICDLQRNTFKLIPNEMYELLTVHKHKTIAEIKAYYGNQEDEGIDEYFQFLIDSEYGFWTDQPEAFPELDLSWEHPSTITNAILDVNSSSAHDYDKIFNELELLGCEHIEIRIFDHIAKDDLYELLMSCKQYHNRIRGIDLLMKYDAIWDEEKVLNAVLKDFMFVHSITLHTAQKNERKDSDLGVFRYLVNEIDSSDHCGVIVSYYFKSSIERFTESKNYNSCLNRKIAVDVEGKIKNCPSMPASYGNINNTSLLDVAQNIAFQKVWHIHKDQIKVCKDCEYRHVCSDCRAFVEEEGDQYSKPSKCNYDPYSASWKMDA